MSNKEQEWVEGRRDVESFLVSIFSVSVPFNLKLVINVHSCLLCYQDVVTACRIFTSLLENGIMPCPWD